jgi:hypothetical protein
MGDRVTDYACSRGLVSDDAGEVRRRTEDEGMNNDR